MSVIARASRFAVGAGLASAVFVVASCGGSASSQQSESSVTTAPGSSSSAVSTSSVDVSGVTVTYGYSTTRGKSRHATQLASGAFDNLPFSVKWAEFANGEDATAAMLADRIDMQEAQPSALATTAASASTEWTAANSPVKVIGALKYQTTEGIQIVVPDDSPVKTVADLRGKRVVFSRGSQSQYFLVLALQKAGLEASDVIQVKMKLSEARAAFAAGEVDAIVAFDFNILSLFRQAPLRVIARSADYDMPLYSLVVVRAKLLADPASAEALRLMMAGLVKVEEWVGTHIDDARRLKEELDGVDPLDSELSVRYGISTFVPISSELIAAVQAQADLFHAEGIVERLPDMGALFDDRFTRTP